MRLFVAFDLPGRVRRGLPEPGAPWRPVPRENLHVTAVFLGDVHDLEPVEAALDSAIDARAGRLRVAEAILLPPRRPRVLAVRLDDRDGICAQHQAAIAEALEMVGVYEPENRPWLPHVTVGRTRERVPGGRSLPEVAPVEFRPTALTLYESRAGRYLPRWQRALGRVPRPAGRRRR